jgi:hypothetical protein
MVTSEILELTLDPRLKAANLNNSNIYVKAKVFSEFVGKGISKNYQSKTKEKKE